MGLSNLLISVMVFCILGLNGLLKFVARKSWDSGKSSSKFFVCGDIIRHLTIVKSFICEHIKIACSSKTEYNGFFFAGFFTFECFVHGYPDCMSTFRCRQNSLYSGKLYGCVKYSSLFYRTCFLKPFMIKLR